MISKGRVKKLIREQIRIWNYTSILTSTLIIIYMIVSKYLGLTTSSFYKIASSILLTLFGLPFGIAIGLRTALKILKEYKET